jgi:hypothetical protein
MDHKHIKKSTKKTFLKEFGEFFASGGPADVLIKTRKLHMRR